MRELARFRGAGPVVSVYLDVDGRRHIRPADYEAAFERMVKPHVDAAARDLVKRIEEIRSYVKAGFDRSTVRGVAVFCGVGLWETVELPMPVRNQSIVNDTPHVSQLEAVLDNHERIGVLLTDQQRARVFVFELGELLDKSELFDELPRHEDDQGEWRRDHVHDHQAAAAQRHVKRAAEAAFAAWQEQRFEHLVLGAPEELVGDVERSLHSYLQRRVAARVALPVAASESDIHRAVLEVEETIERDRKADLVHQLRAAHASGNAGLAGLDDVLPAVGDKRVGTLLVSLGYESPGWRCDGCGHLAAKGPKCNACGEHMVRIDDVVEEAIEEALNQNCRVEVCDGNADLDVLGRIGALLRF
ncbi:MAG: peptide chain release factor subunit 1 [Actinomycetota bacterium]|nr:peptide chain release factor subunit 1 [Actinomycetota bacterium]